MLSNKLPPGKSLLRATIGRIRQSGPATGLRRRPRIIWDDNLAVGDFGAERGDYPAEFDKEEISRRYIFSHAAKLGRRARFLDVGGKDGSLTYLLGNRGPLWQDESLRAANAKRFAESFDYFGLDLHPAGANVVTGDICSSTFRQEQEGLRDSFDVIYSNNVFEHLQRPWIAAENLSWLLRQGGLCITIAPFSQRYHEDPGDYFRYTHKGLEALFGQAGKITILESGYDTRARRYDWQGSGGANDIVATDRYGAWRETWFSVLVFEKAQA